jgi:uroporphyrinogen-III decarboxylase
LDTILELPKGWGIGWFERANINRVWDKLAGHTTVMGGVPTSLISKGTPEKIEEYVKNLLNDVKPEGGFIIAPTVMDIPKETPPVNLRAFINAVEKYGRY